MHCFGRCASVNVAKRCERSVDCDLLPLKLVDDACESVYQIFDSPCRKLRQSYRAGNVLEILGRLLITVGMAHPEQMGFGFEQIQEEKETAHLPSERDAGITAYREMLVKHNRAMLESDEARVMGIRKEANRLAVKLNGGEPGILSGPDAPGHILMRETAAPAGTVPIWGQEGEFDIKVGDMPVHIKMDGMLGICQSMSMWPGFSANVVEPAKPFFSETGFRSFIGVHAEPTPGITPDAFAREVITSHIKGECKGKLRPVKEEYRGRY
jgi:hypothetical protein